LSKSKYQNKSTEYLKLRYDKHLKSIVSLNEILALLPRTTVLSRWSIQSSINAEQHKLDEITEELHRRGII
jgi:hypothetical protein